MRSPTRRQRAVAAAEDQVDEDHEDQVADVKCSYFIAYLHHRKSKVDFTDEKRLVSSSIQSIKPF